MDVKINDKFWYEDINILFDKQRLIEFIPLKDHTIEELLNAIVRFSVYITILMYIFKRYILLILLPIFTLGITFYIYYKNKKYIDINSDEQFPCYKPTEMNPLMNILISDYGYNNDRKKACPVEHVKKDIQKYINRTLYKNSFDILSDDFQERQYYTMPITTIPNDQEDFANWLYKEEDTCKTNMINCKIDEDLRQERESVVNYK